jgi:hypothetical protein
MNGTIYFAIGCMVGFFLGMLSLGVIAATRQILMARRINQLKHENELLKIENQSLKEEIMPGDSF